MYINEVIRRADTLAPNKYTLEEKYAWCDELNAMLSQEYLEKYKKAVLEPDENGEYLLPEGITFEMIDKIISQGREIVKYDFRSFGIKPLYGTRERVYIPEHCQRHGAITVIYMAQSQPIRTVKDENITVTYALHGTDIPPLPNSAFTGIKVKPCRYQRGDTLKIISGDTIFENIHVTGVEVQGDGSVMCELENADGLFELQGSNYTEDPPYHAYDKWYFKDITVTIERVVTDETLCPPPYDVMYVEFLLAQMAKGQRSFNVYNQHMNVFNQKLRAYHNWLMKRRTQNKDNKMRNWW